MNRRFESIHLLSAAILFCLILVVIALRLYRLAELPPGLYVDEGWNGLSALKVLEGEHAVFFQGNAGHEGLFAYTIALAQIFLGQSILSVRLPAALAGSLAVLTLYWLGQILFGPEKTAGRTHNWRGIFIGGVAAACLATSLSYTIIGRLAFRANLFLLILPLSLSLLWWSWRRNNWWGIVMAGILAGLMLYTYIPSRLFPFLLLAFAMTCVPVIRLRDELPRAIAFTTVAFVVSSPLLYYFFVHPDQFLERSGQSFVLAYPFNQGKPLSTLLLNVWEHVLAFGFRGDPRWLYNYDGRPLLNPWQALFFWVGVGVAVWNWWRRPAHRLLLLWLGIMLLPAVLSRDLPPKGVETTTPNTLRMIGAAPAAFLLIAVGLWQTLLFLHKRLTAKLTTVLICLIAASIISQAFSTFQTYYREWALAPEVHKEHSVPWAELASALNVRASSPHDPFLVVQVDADRNYTLEYLYSDAAPVHIVNAPVYALGDNMKEMARDAVFELAARESSSTVKMVDWQEDLIEEAEVELFSILSKTGRLIGSEKFASFQIHSFANLSLRIPWQFYEEMESLLLQYDGGISLLGISVGIGGDEMPTGNPIPLQGGNPLWVGFRWQTDSDVANDYKASLRLYDESGAYPYNKDRFLKNLDGDTSSRWTPGKPVDTLFFVDVPQDLPPGLYELRLVVYNAETFTPTVLEGTWAPELVLADVWKE